MHSAWRRLWPAGGSKCHVFDIGEDHTIHSRWFWLLKGFVNSQFCWFSRNIMKYHEISKSNGSFFFYLHLYMDDVNLADSLVFFFSLLQCSDIFQALKRNQSLRFLDLRTSAVRVGHGMPCSMPDALGCPGMPWDALGWQWHTPCEPRQERSAILWRDDPGVEGRLEWKQTLRSSPSVKWSRHHEMVADQTICENSVQLAKSKPYGWWCANGITNHEWH